MNAVTLDSHFYQLSKEQMEEMCPSDIRLIVRKAFDLPCSGMGPGPTMAEVIKHYNEERNYRILRSMAGEDTLRQAWLDELFGRATLMDQPGSLHWTVPTIVSGREARYRVGFFDFSEFSDTSAYEHLAADLQL